MLRPLLGVVGLVLALAVSLVAQAPGGAPAGPPPDALWTVAQDVAAPESAHFHAASNSVFVSSINGGILEKDGNGYISRLRPDGTVVSMKWATGLNAPKGMRSVGNTLWTADIDEVVAIDIETGRITQRVAVEGAQFLNDLATAPDGTVYVSDSNLSRIYAVKDGTASIFVDGADQIGQPNGVLVDEGRLIVGTMGAGGRGGGRGGRAGGGGGGGAAAQEGGRLIAFDLKTKARTVVSDPIGGIDGIEPDGAGGFLVTDVFGSRLVHVPAGGEMRTLLTFQAAGADFGFIPARRVALVPFLFGNSVSAFDLSNALR